jgi:hypothetical protein
MSDFLSRMAQRALGAESELRPDVRPLFAMASREPGEEPRGDERDVVARPEPSSSAETVAPQQRRASEASVQSAQGQHSRGGTRRGNEENAGPQPRVAVAGIATPERMPVTTPSSHTENDPQSTAPRLWRTASDAGSIEPGVARESDAHRTPLVAQMSERRTIHITIGRIEVRAATPTFHAPAPPHRDAPRNELRTLDSYLSERDGRRR